MGETWSKRSNSMIARLHPIQTKPEPACPECGARMRLRRPKSGQYPDCRGTRDIGDDGRPIIDEEPAA